MMTDLQVTIHPLVLLSAADHYHRVALNTRKRVVGILLGQVIQGNVEATNSFAVPFEEDSKNPAVFYLDHNYLENMLAMFRKVSAKERVVGFYSTGPQIRPNDLRIHDVVANYTQGTTTAFCVIDVRPDRQELPVKAYKVVQVSTEDSVSRTFTHLPVQMGALEAEEVGVEHLLRDINDPTISTVASLVRQKQASLGTLHEKLLDCQAYLEQASNDPNANTEILANLQTIQHLLPNLQEKHLVQSIIAKTNDYYMAIYLAALVRSILALHDLINNKLRYGPDGTVDHEEKKEEQPKAKLSK